MMVICYLEKKSFIDINFIFTVCANLQYISNHLKRFTFIHRIRSGLGLGPGCTSVSQ